MKILDNRYESPVIDITTAEVEGMFAASITSEKLVWESDSFEME